MSFPCTIINRHGIIICIIVPELVLIIEPDIILKFFQLLIKIPQMNSGSSHPPFSLVLQITAASTR